MYDKRLASEVDGEDLGDEFKGYVFKITGGQDKDGFSMKQGVLTTDRVKLMMAKGATLPLRPALDAGSTRCCGCAVGGRWVRGGGGRHMERGGMREK
mgnify:CR=1 FL=1